VVAVNNAAADTGAIVLYDVSDPASPSELGSLPDESEPIRSVRFLADGLFVTANGGTERGATVYQLLNETDPTPFDRRSSNVARWDGRTDAFLAEVIGNNLIVLDKGGGGPGGIWRADISDTSNIVGVGYLDLPAAVKDMAISGSQAFVANEDGTVIYRVDLTP